MNISFSPGDVIVSPKHRHTFLVIEAKRLNLTGTARWRQAGWILTAMKLDGSSEVVTTYFDSATWSKINT